MANQLVRILLVEDNPGDAGLFRISFDEMGSESFTYELTHVVRLVEALAYVEKSPFDLVFLDLSLPDASGIEAVIRMRDTAPNLPIVVMSGLLDENVADETRRLGAAAFLVKGQADGTMLGRVIDRAMGRNRLETSPR